MRKRSQARRFLGSAYHTDEHVRKVWAFVDRAANPPCWTWTGIITHQGYGRYTPYGSDHFPAHRVVYELERGQIPEGLVLDHLCRNTRCVNPSHLEVVTQKENCLRGFSPAAQKARQTTCLQGHPLEGDNLKRRKQGFRVCKICRRQGVIDSRRRKMAERRQNGLCAECGQPSDRYRCGGCRATLRAKYAAKKVA